MNGSMLGYSCNRGNRHGFCFTGIFGGFLPDKKPEEGRRMKMMKKTGWIALGVLLAMGISGCQSNPDSSIVVNKDLDRLIEEARNK